MDPTTLVYIVGGVLLLLWILLSIGFIALWVRINNLEKNPKSPENNVDTEFRLERPRRILSNGSVSSYGFPEIVPGEELYKRGFTSHPEPQLQRFPSMPNENSVFAGDNRNNPSNYGKNQNSTFTGAPNNNPMNYGHPSAAGSNRNPISHQKSFKRQNSNSEYQQPMKNSSVVSPPRKPSGGSFLHGPNSQTANNYGHDNYGYNRNVDSRGNFIY